MPVPHAEIHLPRSDVSKPDLIRSIASFWCARSPNLTAFFSWKSSPPRSGLHPVDRRLRDLGQPDPLHRDRLVGQRVLGMLRPPVSGGNDDPVGERDPIPRLAGGGEERIDVLLVQRPFRVIELALDRRPLTESLLRATRWRFRGGKRLLPMSPLRPALHLVVLHTERRVQPEVVDHQPLELLPSLGVRRRGPEVLDHVMDGRPGRQRWAPSAGVLTTRYRAGPTAAGASPPCRRTDPAQGLLETSAGVAEVPFTSG